MKKILLATTLVMAFGLSSYAQSKFTVANAAATAVTFSGGAQDGAKVLSTGSAKYWAELYLGPTAASVVGLGTVKPIGVNAAAAGLFSFGTVTVANLPSASQVFAQVRGWRADGGGTAGGYDGATERGANTPAQVTTKDSPPVVLFGQAGVTAFQIVVPEPGSMMLAGLGLSGLLLLRRRK